MLSLLFGLVATTGCFFDDEIVAMATVRFASGAVDVDDGALVDLADLAAIGARDGATVCITGHADDVGDADFNRALGEKRAGAVAAAMLAHGVDAASIRVESVGEDEPVVRADDDGARARNRRVVVVVHHQRTGDPDNDVLDQPLVATQAATTPRTRLKTRPKAPKPPAWIDDVDPELRRAAGALVVGSGAACGAGVTLGLCCLAPFSAPFGASVAADAIGAAAEPDAMTGASVGAALGALIGGTAGVVVGVVAADPRDRGATAFAAGFAVALPATVVGAGVGAAVGWWRSPSGLHAAAPLVQNQEP